MLLLFRLVVLQYVVYIVSWWRGLALTYTALSNRLFTITQLVATPSGF
jgi:hypothetical protein